MLVHIASCYLMIYKCYPFLQALTGRPGQSNLEYLPTMPLANDDVIMEYRSQVNTFLTPLNT